LKKAIELGKSYGNAYVTKAEILIAKGDRKKALKNLQKAVKLGENSNYVFDLIDECNKYASRTLLRHEVA
jgi:tetratricopeptide (TPR) repeat protein